MRRERGAATAELVAVLPGLVAVVLALAWLLSLGIAQARTVDAARETARAVARGDEDSAAVGRGRQVAPAGTTIAISHDGTRVVATASVEVHGPGGLLGFLPGAHLHASATAADEAAAASP
ncbi:TadE family type IV pilus minor pilin [Nocardioides nematodiphilus]|uniref:TadE family type IV pilus minor pilin n=1 Tax=Nocardioides nematodiphilus TaxID=2849669 RepID=UPI001CD99226|nr:TadE family type IV pilus minor pilin [Nocardioides nematodiphilus]MCA1981683.1 pilus assembly protein [Nocardioides nematodiphilus]